LFTKVDFIYDNAVASIKTGIGVKSESELIISGTKGFIFVPSPWWKMDYFEVRFEQEEDKKRYFYQLDGEGIRYAFSDFARKINAIDKKPGIEKEVTLGITDIIEDYLNDYGVDYLK
jgi:choline-phosphate cytidylyltransferase